MAIHLYPLLLLSMRMVQLPSLLRTDVEDKTSMVTSLLDALATRNFTVIPNWISSVNLQLFYDQKLCFHKKNFGSVPKTQFSFALIDFPSIAIPRPFRLKYQAPERSITARVSYFVAIMIQDWNHSSFRSHKDQEITSLACIRWNLRAGSEALLSPSPFVTILHWSLPTNAY